MADTFFYLLLGSTPFDSFIRNMIQITKNWVLIWLFLCIPDLDVAKYYECLGYLMNVEKFHEYRSRI